MREVGQRQRLQPDLSGSRQPSDKKAVPAKDDVLDPWNNCDVEVDGGIEHPNVPGMHHQLLSRCQVITKDFASQFDPGCGIPA